jgi:hypothetical protein
VRTYSRYRLRAADRTALAGALALAVAAVAAGQLVG